MKCFDLIPFLIQRLFVLISGALVFVHLAWAGSDIEVTLISPELGQEVDSADVELEGLVNDLSVKEVKVLVNSQEVQFVPVNKGYFQRKLNFDQRENRLTIYGANFDRKYFRYEFTYINSSKAKKTLEQKVPPILKLNHLQEGKFKILSPREYETLEMTAHDNSDDIVQLGYVLNDGAPVYLKYVRRPINLNLERDRSRKSSYLHLFAIDGDGNKTVKNFHFRVEHMECSLKIMPEYGIYADTPLIFKARVQGGSGKVKKQYIAISSDGMRDEKKASGSRTKLSLKHHKIYRTFMGRLELTDSNGVEARCDAKEKVHFYPAEHPAHFEISNKSKFESMSQRLAFSIQPPIRKGEITVLLKKNGVSG